MNAVSSYTSPPRARRDSDQRGTLTLEREEPHCEPHERAPFGIRGPRLLNDPRRVRSARRIRLRLRRTRIGNGVERVDADPTPADGGLEGAVEDHVNVPERRATERLADVRLAPLVALIIGVRPGRTALPVLDEVLAVAASPAAAKVGVELLDQRRSRLGEPSQLDIAERRDDERLGKEAVVLDGLRVRRMLVQPRRVTLPSESAVRVDLWSDTSRRKRSRSRMAAASSAALPVRMSCLPVCGSRPPYTRTWYEPPRRRMPWRSFARPRRAVLVAAMKAAYDRLLTNHWTAIAQRSRSLSLKRGNALLTQGVHRVRRQGLEPRTRGLRVRCSAN
jgi:hypothetical protein